MTLDEIIIYKTERLTSIPDKLISATQAIQKDQYIRLLEMVSTLEKDGGMIVANKKNLAIVEKILQVLKDELIDEDPAIVTEYEKAVRSFVSEMKKQTAITNDLFEKTFPDETISTEFASDVALSSRTNAANLLLGSSAESAFFDPIREQLSVAIASSASYSETVQALKDIVLGDPEKAGAIESHIKQIAHDTFAVADRSYTKVLSDENKAEWYRWAGSEIPTTRPFCAERHQKYFHKKEIEAWGNGEKTIGMAWPKNETWAGETEGTTSQTIFNFAGGFNCRHSIMPVSIARVPKDVIERAIAQGFYKP